MGQWIADRRRIKWALLIVVMLLCCCLVVAFWVYRNSIQPLQVVANAVDAGVKLAMDSVEHTAMRDGKVQWRLKADSAALEASGEMLILTAPQVVFYADDGRAIHMTADQGRLNTKTNDLAVSGNVTIRDQEYRMRTERLRYRHQENRLAADQPVAVDGSWASLTADTMEIDLSSRRATFSGQVRGVIRDGIS